MVRCAMLLSVLVLLHACSGDDGPQQAVRAFTAFQRALQTRDAGACRQLLTHESRPVVDQMPWEEIGDRAPLEVLGATRARTRSRGRRGTSNSSSPRGPKSPRSSTSSRCMGSSGRGARWPTAPTSRTSNCIKPAARSSTRSRQHVRRSSLPAAATPRGSIRRSRLGSRLASRASLCQRSRACPNEGVTTRSLRDGSGAHGRAARAAGQFSRRPRSWSARRAR